MFFKRIAPDPLLNHIIECYWTVEDEDPLPQQQKIIPDFPKRISYQSDGVDLTATISGDGRSIEYLFQKK